MEIMIIIKEALMANTSTQGPARSADGNYISLDLSSVSHPDDRDRSPVSVSSCFILPGLGAAVSHFMS